MRMNGFALALGVTAALLSPAGAASRKKECRAACEGLIATCVANGAAAGYGDLTKGCTKAVLKRCRAEGPAACSGYCGDGIVNGNETCEQATVGTRTCIQLGFQTGILGCTLGCGFDTTGCIPFTCGNGMADRLVEECDGTDLRGHTCLTKGFYAGNLSCTDQCTFDTSSCNNTRFVANEDGTVTDNASRLTWERKTDSFVLCLGGSLQCVNNTYSFSDALAFFIPQINQLEYAGFSDWRLPSFDELATIGSFQLCPPPCIDPIFGPTQANDYWSREFCSGSNSMAIGINFNNGFSSCSSTASAFGVRAVRGGR
jgi:hypothetical protein